MDVVMIFVNGKRFRYAPSFKNAPFCQWLLMNWDMNIGPVTAYVKLLVVWIWGFVEIVFALLAYFFD